MNKVVLIGRLTKEPEMRKLASGKTVTQFSIATHDYRTGSEKSEFHSVVTCDMTGSTRTAIWAGILPIGSTPLTSRGGATGGRNGGGVNVKLTEDTIDTAAGFLSERHDFLHVFVTRSVSGNGWDVVLRIDGTYPEKDVAEGAAVGIREWLERLTDVEKSKRVWWDGPPR